MGDGTEKSPYIRKDVLRLIEANGGKAEGLDLSGKIFEKGIDLNNLYPNVIILERARLTYAHLEGADLRRAYLK